MKECKLLIYTITQKHSHPYKKTKQKKNILLQSFGGSVNIHLIIQLRKGKHELLAVMARGHSACLLVRSLFVTVQVIGGVGVANSPASGLLTGQVHVCNQKLTR